MSDYSSLKATINANVKANNNHEITGAIMNSVLNAMVNSLGAGYQFMGVATPTNPGSSQTPDYKCFYLATTPGTYTNLGGLVVSDGEVALLKWDTAWSKEVTGAATAAQLTQLGQEVSQNTSDIVNIQQEVDAIQPIVIEGNVTNAPDQEDITTDNNNLLKFADRPTALGQMGYKILRKDATFAAQVTEANTIYEIRYEFDLDGASVAIPAGCALRFCGGKIDNGIVVGNNTIIYANVVQIIGATLSGTWNVDVAYPEWFGAKADGVTDDSGAIQMAFDNFHRIYFPAASYAIMQVFPKSNSVVEFSAGCHIVAAGPLADTSGEVLAQRMIDLREVHDVTIVGNNATIDMRRADYPLEESGESRHGVAINGCQNITITDLMSNNTFGDGYCLGFPMSSDYNNDNIKLIRCSADNNRRQGLSIVDGENVIVDGCVFTNTHGTLPSAGIDIEPNYADNIYRINNIFIINCECSGNNTGLLMAASLKIKDEYNNREVNIVVDNFVAKRNSQAISLQNDHLAGANGGITIRNIYASGLIFLRVGSWGGHPSFITKIDNANFVKTADDPNAISNSFVVFRHETSTIDNDYIGDIQLTDVKFSAAENITYHWLIYFNPMTQIPLSNVRAVIDRGSMESPVLSWRENTPIFCATQYSQYNDIFFEITPFVLVSNLQGSSTPLINKVRIGGNAVINLSDKYSTMPGHEITFERYIQSTETGNGTIDFTISDTTLIYNSRGQKLTSLSIADPGGYLVDGRKNINGECITFIARPNGWWVKDFSNSFRDIHLVKMTPWPFIGTSTQRPNAVNVGAGCEYFDTTLGKMIVSDGTSWVNMDGTALS